MIFTSFEMRQSTKLEPIIMEQMRFANANSMRPFPPFSGEMVRQARVLAQATSDLVNAMRSDAEAEVDLDNSKKLLAAAKLLADATARMVEAAKVRSWSDLCCRRSHFKGFLHDVTKGIATSHRRLPTLPSWCLFHLCGCISCGGDSTGLSLRLLGSLRLLEKMHRRFYSFFIRDLSAEAEGEG